MHFPDIYPVFHPLQRYNPIMTKLPGRIESAIPMHSVADQNLRGHTPIGHRSVVADEKPVGEKISPQLHRFRLTGRDTWTVDARPFVTGNFRNFVRVLIWNSRYRQSAALTTLLIYTDTLLPKLAENSISLDDYKRSYSHHQRLPRMRLAAGFAEFLFRYLPPAKTRLPGARASRRRRPAFVLLCTFQCKEGIRPDT